MPSHLARHAGFTLVELMVVVAIIATLLSILLPSLSDARRQAMTTHCLSNMRNMQVAHAMYMASNNDHFINVGLAHGGLHANEETAWINTLREYYGADLLHRSPVDDSPYWDQPIPGTGGQMRRTSYGVNDYLTPALPFSTRYLRLQSVPRPHATVQFVIMTFGHQSHEVEFAGSDHVHAYLWWNSIPRLRPALASRHVQIDAHGGPPMDTQSRSNYGYLDGHAEINLFEDVYQTRENNRFNPRFAQ